jgi:lipoprotein-anchoring transpeptidase ErfK/SrfK
MQARNQANPPKPPSRTHVAAHERMLQRRRRSLGVLSLVVLTVTFAITLTRQAPQQASAAARTPTQVVPVGVFSPAATVPAGAAVAGASAADLTAGTSGTVAKLSKSKTWNQPGGAKIKCPVQFVGCVDLKAKVTWVQRHGKIVLGPVRMQPGQGAQKTPKGTFTVNRKAAVYFSHTYGGAMPYSVFFGHDGIAWHEGTLTGYSHGCIHLTMANAKRFFKALHSGDRVYVA